MMKYQIHIKSKTRKNAILEGAEKFGVEPSQVVVLEEDGENFIIVPVNSPGEFEIEVRDDKIAAFLKTITPASGTGKSVTVEDIEKSLSEAGITYGIEKDVILTTVTEVNTSGKIKKNIVIAKGVLSRKGENAKIELKTGRDALNKDPKASSIVKPGQIVAVKIPATSGIPGKDIFGEELQPIRGDDIKFLPGENVIIKDNNYISEAYGSARGTWQGISVTDFVNMSKDRMYVEMSIFPVLADNGILSFDDIENILQNKGIKYGINYESIRAALEKGVPVENLRVAEAIPAKNGIDAGIEFQFKMNGEDPEEADKKRNDSSGEFFFSRDVVEEGEILAKKIPSVKPEDGRSVTGDVLKGLMPNDKKIKAGDNVETRDNGLIFIPSEGIVAGYADFSIDTISVESPLSISEDKLSASISLYPSSSKRRPLSIDHIKRIINKAGIRYGIALGEIEQFLSSVTHNTFSHKSFVVAQGKNSVDGNDAVIKLKFDGDKQAGSLVNGTDRMDFKEQSLIHNVRKGDILAEKVPLTTGISGKNIFGEPIPASPGKDKKLTPGANVLLSDNVFTADVDGMVLVSDGDKISVLKTYEISDDIDMRTGNLAMDGSLLIKGWICAGFVVRASGEIHVGKGIAQASVDAGAGLYINGGILGDGKATILSGGKLTAFFVENAKVHSKNDITIRDDIRNSIVSSCSSIDVTGGKGRIIGGVVTAFRGINAHEIGSTVGVKTSIIVGVDPETSRRMEQITKKLEDFRHQRAKIDMYLDRYSNKKKLNDFSKSIRFRIDKLISQRRNIVQTELKLNNYRENLMKRDKADYQPPSVTVNKMVYAGTSITIEEAVFEVKEDIPGKVKFYLNEDNHVTYK